LLYRKGAAILDSLGLKSDNFSWVCDKLVYSESEQLRLEWKRLSTLQLDGCDILSLGSNLSHD
jgi:hypothetical protein